MERSEFRDIMFQYKKAKELDPQLKYWDWKADKYEKGSDGIKATPEQEKQINEHMQKMHRMSGAISPVINLQDAADFTPVGNATTAYEAYDAAESGDYLTASLIGAAALAPRAVSKGVKKIWREIPSVNPNYVKDKLTEFFGNEKVRKLLPNGLKTEIYEDAINQRNHIIEELYHDKDYWDRAAAIKKQFGDDYPEIYRGLLDTYENRYLGLPEPKVKSFNNGAKAEMSASEQAKERFRLNRIPAGYTDFEYNISPHLDKIDNPTTLHELNHYIDFNLAKNGNADYGNNMFVEMKKDLSTADNILYPDKTDYFRQGTEQKSYMNTLRSYMNSIGLMDSPGQKVSTKIIKKAIQSLPSEMNAVRAAYLQFNSPGQYTKWFNKIPLLGTAGAGLYFGNKEDNSYSDGTYFIQPKRFNPSDYATDNIPSKASADKALNRSEQLRPNYKRYEINHNDLSPTDAVYEDIRLIDNTKPRFELRKGNDIPTYYSDKYLKYIRSLGSVLKTVGPVLDFMQYTFPTEQQEKFMENYLTDYSKRKNNLKL